MPLRRSKRVTNSSLPKSNTPLMLRAVGVGVGRRCYLRGSRIAVKEERGSWGLRLPYLPLPLLEGRPSQCRCSSTFHAPKSSHIDIPQTSKSSLASLPSGSSVKVAGWLISRRRIGKSLSFAVLLLPRGQGRLQLIARSEEGSGEENENIAVWDEAGNHGVVLVEGQLQCKPSKDVRQEQEKVSRLGAKIEQCLMLSIRGSPIHFLILNYTSATQRYSTVYQLALYLLTLCMTIAQ
jgi:hypothetical protein